MKMTPTLQVNIPCKMFYESYLDRFIQHGLNPEIGFDADALDRYTPAELGAMARRLHQNALHVTLHGPFMDLSPGSPDPEIRAVTRHRFEQLMEIVPVFKPKTVVCHTGYDHRRYWHIRDTWLENSLRFWTWAGDKIQNAGSVLVLENVYEQTPQELGELLKPLQSRAVGFCLDTGHQSVFGSAPMETWVETLAPFLVQLHLHDNTGSRDDHLALGTGNIDFKKLFHHLNALDRSPHTITLEPHRAEALWPSIKYLEALCPW
ncbi:MAG: sugar phosphate isomerase/epimerase [Deltaproteobacteria bacterium]|nr:sugar phosphate isomerase/epimerase [Deltaproteobacteria bacterium]